MKFLILTWLVVASLSAQGATTISCTDDMSFTPIEFTVIDDDTAGPTIKFSGMYSNQALGALGFLTEDLVAWHTRDFVLTLPNQPRKYIYSGDDRVRHYTRSDVLGTSIVRFQHEGKEVAKAVYFEDLIITKLVTASMGVAYQVELSLKHSDKSWTYRKVYYETSCR